MSGRIAVLVAAAFVLSLAMSHPARASMDGTVRAGIGGNYSLMLEKGGSSKAHAGGFAIDLEGTIWIHKVVGMKWDMLDLEAIFHKDSSWFHVGGDWGVVLDLRFVHLFTGVGLFYNRLKVGEDGDTAFKVPAAVGFRWPVELGIHFWRIGLFGGLQFDFVARKHRVSHNALLGDETTAYAGLGLHFGDKGVDLTLMWKYRMLDDDATAHAMFLMLDLVPLVRKIGDKDDDGPPPDDGPVEPYTPPAPVAETKTDLRKNIDGFVDQLDKLDDTMSILRLEKALGKVGFDQLVTVQTMGSIKVKLEVPDWITQYVFAPVAADQCKNNQQFNSKDVVVAYCYAGADDGYVDVNELDTFWDTSHAALTDQYGPTASEVLYDAGGFMQGLLDAKTTGVKVETFATRSTSEPWVTLEMGIDEWTSDTQFKMFACIYYTPRIGSCSPPPGNQVSYEGVTVPVTPPWYSPGCELATSCVVDNLKYDISGDILEPWDCSSDAVFVKMLDDDAKFLGLGGLPYESMSWIYLGQSTEVRIYKNDAGGEHTLLTTQRSEGKCYTAVFDYFPSCTDCPAQIQKLLEGVGYAGKAAPTAKVFNGLTMPVSSSLTVDCMEDIFCDISSDEYQTHVMLNLPVECSSPEVFQSFKTGWLQGLGVDTAQPLPKSEIWTMQDLPAEVYFLGETAMPGLEAIALIQYANGQCITAVVTYPPGCAQCSMISRKIIVGIRKK